MLTGPKVRTWIDGVTEQRIEKMFKPKRQKVKRECKKQHNEELYDLYSSPNIILGLAFTALVSGLMRIPALLASH
jgi:hypothetical protein